MHLYIVLAVVALLLAAAVAILWSYGSGSGRSAAELSSLELELEVRKPPTYEINRGEPVLTVRIRNPASEPVTVQEIRLRIGDDPGAVDVDVSREDYFGGARLLPCRLGPTGGEVTFWIDLERLRDLVRAGRNGSERPEVVLRVVDSWDRIHRRTIPASVLNES